MTRSLLATYVLASLALVHAPANASSFDCSQARSSDERAVCGNPKLSALDSEMAGLWFAYSRVPMMMGGNDNRNDEARLFLASRQACGGNAGCLADAYLARIATLRREIEASMIEFSRLQNGN